MRAAQIAVQAAEAVGTPQWLTWLGIIVPILTVAIGLLEFRRQTKKDTGDREETREERIQNLADAVLAQKVEENDKLNARIVVLEKKTNALGRYLRQVLAAHIEAGLVPPAPSAEDREILDLEIPIPDSKE